MWQLSRISPFPLNVGIVMLLTTRFAATFWIPFPCRTFHGPFSINARDNDSSEPLTKRNATSAGGKNSFSGRIYFEKLGEIKESIDIVAAIESYGLERFERKGGNRATAICPFHEDRNPSLSVDGTRNMYKCFACGEGGDIFRFVSEYAKLKGETMSFYDSVKFASENFAGDSVTTFVTERPTSARLTPDEMQTLKLRKDRILLANTASAAFYAECLAKPSFGGVRYYLRSRMVLPAAVRAFAIGFAPDCYFGSGVTKSTWGIGSLVEHLKSLNFTADELIDAGLAVRCKEPNGGPNRDGIHQLEGNGAASVDYSMIMDRFRGRIVVPIFDQSGSRVLGFGGRALPQQPERKEKAQFEVPKYINSPETLVFEKKSVLFGYQIARRSEIADVILVEGYMDAIVLWSAGVNSVVASMGTAVSTEHLLRAANLASSRGGRVVLCLDNDDAGIAAVERLISNNIIADVSKQTNVYFTVASLPEGIKDPAQFVESLAAENIGGNFSAVFHDSVVNNSLDWKRWNLKWMLDNYEKRLLQGCNETFNTLFESLSEFIASLSVPAERTKLVVEVAQPLADILAKTTDRDSTSSAMRNQLESDLLDLVSRKVASNEVLQRRVEMGGTVSPSDVRTFLSSMSRGEGPSSSGDSFKLSRRAAMEHDDGNAMILNANVFHSSKKSNLGESVPGASPRTRARSKLSRNAKPVLTPHFSGFRFLHPSDAYWMGLSRKKGLQSELLVGVKRGDLLSSVGEPRVDDSETFGSIGRPVYFNSNDYHGQQYISNEAVAAGYDNRWLERDPTVLKHGVAALLKEDTTSMAMAAEDSLLTVLVKHKSARTCTKNMLDARKAVGSDVSIQWSLREKEWLFERLVVKPEKFLIHSNSERDLREHLKALPDVPEGAFRDDDTRPGTLDCYFDTTNGDVNNQVNFTEIQNQLLVQELFTSLLWASTAEEARQIRRELSILPQQQHRNYQLPVGTTSIAESSDDKPAVPDEREGDETNNTSLDERQKHLAQKLQESTRLLQNLRESRQRMSSRLLDESKANESEGKLSHSMQVELGTRLDNHLAELRDSTKDSHDHDDVPYEDILERLEEEWGDWYDDDYYWSPEHARASKGMAVQNPLFIPDENPETAENLEETLRRIDKEWEAWTS